MTNDYKIMGEIAVIYLKSQNGVVRETIIDTLDLELVAGFNGSWVAQYRANSDCYVVRGNERVKDGVQKKVYLHRFLLNAPAGMHVDHINRNTLDNRRSMNLRLATPAQNNQNRRARPCKSGVRGVSWHPQHQKWQATVAVNGKNKYIGIFETIAEAERAVKAARARYMPFSEEALSNK